MVMIIQIWEIEILMMMMKIKDLFFNILSGFIASLAVLSFILLYPFMWVYYGVQGAGIFRNITESRVVKYGNSIINNGGIIRSYKR